MVVSCSRLGNGGRLGNQLFAIGSTLGIAQANNAEASFPPWQYERYFKQPIPHNGLASRQYNEKQFHYEAVEINQDVDLFGYFQSYKYFPKEYKPQFSDEIINQWKDHEVFNKETISVHIRRGDYINHELYYQLPVSWFISVMISIPNWQECNILFFSDDLEYCKVHFECLPNAFFIKGFEIDHLCLMSLCDHHIVGNSSYAWWGAYLSSQKDVIHSGKMFRGGYSHKDIKDYYPPEWNIHTEEKINLTNTTFTIPVLYDHADRKQNLDLGLCILQKNFNTNIIIGEQGKEKKFEYTGKWCRYQYFEGMLQFHRTKMLNDMALMADTEFIVNWDVDIMIPPMQLYLSVERLKSGVDCVYPYDGRFARMDRMQWFRKLEINLDIGCVGKAPLDHRHIKESVGGAVMWRKESFIDFGMENEYMISYAPEDVERWERMHKIGVNVQRVDGTLYHMNHFKGKDSNNHNPFFAESKRLLATYRVMSADELRKEVDSWKWRNKYTESYYNRISPGAIQSAKETYLTLSVFGFNPDYIVDVGCGVGEWALGNPNYIGVDHGIPEKALIIPKEQYQDTDLEKDDYVHMEDKFDLCLCLEVAEHISEARAGWLIDHLCSLSDNVLFSAAIPNQGGTGHINEQWQTYWADRFYANGFGAEVCYPVKDDPEVEFWYRQNMILYKRGSTGKVYNFVLPEYYDQITNYLKNK